MTSPDGEIDQEGTLFKGGHYFPSHFFHMGKLINGGNHGLRTPNDGKNQKNLKKIGCAGKAISSLGVCSPFGKLIEGAFVMYLLYLLV